MLLSEFAKLTGFNSTPECYHDFIEPQYNGSTLEKVEWCKKWKKDHGIERAYDWQVNHNRGIEAKYEQQLNDIVAYQNKIAKLESEKAEIGIKLLRLQENQRKYENWSDPIIQKFSAIKNIIGD